MIMASQVRLYVPAHIALFLLTFPLFSTGELPKELGNLINLKDLRMFDNGFQGKLYVPAYMRCMFADIVTFLQENYPRSWATSSS